MNGLWAQVHGHVTRQTYRTAGEYWLCLLRRHHSETHWKSLLICLGLISQWVSHKKLISFFWHWPTAYNGFVAVVWGRPTCVCNGQVYARILKLLKCRIKIINNFSGYSVYFPVNCYMSHVVYILNLLYPCWLDGVQASEYSTMFNAHLRRCVINHVLPVGADTLEFMLIQGIPPDTTELQQLIHKLGKQNSWSRARTLFRCESHTFLWYSYFFLF